MKEYPTGNIRNIALISHTGAGKTTFVERLLFDLGITTRLGSVQNGTSLMDFEEEEVARSSSVSTSLAPIEHGGLKFNFLDTPGYIDFVGEVNSAMRVADNALVFIEAVGGVEVGTEIVYQASTSRNVPTALVVNKMDRENVRTARVLTSIQDNLNGRFVPAQLPIGEGTSFTGVVDLISMKAYMGEANKEAPIPDDMADAVAEARFEFIETVVEGDDALMEKYFMEEPLTEAEIIHGLREMMRRGEVAPIFFCSGQTGIGTKRLLSLLGDVCLAPQGRGQFTANYPDGSTKKYDISTDSPLAALVFKTREDVYGRTSYIRVWGGRLESDSRVWDANLDAEVRVGSLGAVLGKELLPVDALVAGDIGAVVKLGDTGTDHTLCEKNNMFVLNGTTQPDPIVAVAVHPASQADVAKLNSALHRMTIEDPTLVVSHEAATKETILSGMGDVHINIAVQKLKSKFGVNVTTTTPKIPYLETITRTETAEYTHKKQTGGAGQYARVSLRVESIDDNADVEFDSEIFGGAISAPFVAATEKGVRAVCHDGIIAGYPVKGVRVIVFDGKEHPVDSKEIAFQIAGREAVKAAVMKAGPALMEPIYDVEVTVPTEFAGAIMSDMNPRRGHVQAMEQNGPRTTVKARVPLESMQRYQADLRSMTQGRGVYAMKFAEYGRVPNHLQEKVIAALRESEE